MNMLAQIPDVTTDPDPKYERFSDLSRNGQSIVKAYGLIKAKIMYTLSVYPKISPSMLQVGIGPSTQPAIWRPILDDLIKDGLISREAVEKNTPTGRFNRHEVLSLTDTGRLLVG
jgi:hypothetical protein